MLNARDAGRLEAAAAALAAAGPPTPHRRLRRHRPRGGRRRRRAVERDVGPIAILVNNAGIQHRTPLEDFPVADWYRVMRTNLDSAFYVGQAVARAMIPRGKGAIINVCSVQSELTRPGIAPYTASKGALKMLTKGMAADWGSHGIRVNGIGPGYFAHRAQRRARRRRGLLALGQPAAPRSAAGARSTSSPAPRSSSPPTPPASSAATSSTSTAA